MNDATLRRLHGIERELTDIARNERNPHWRRLIERARDAVAGAAFGPASNAKYAPKPPGLP